MTIPLLFPGLAHAAGEPTDMLPGSLVSPGLFLVILLLALTIAFLGAGYARTRRSLALLIVLVASLGILRHALTLALGSAASLSVFLGTFAVIYLMGRFDSPE